MNSPDILSVAEMKQLYGRFYEKSPRVSLDKRRVSHQFWPLIPYAEFWGIADDWARQEIVDQAPTELTTNLKEVVEAFDGALDEWLAGPEADDPSPSREYIAFV